MRESDWERVRVRYPASWFSPPSKTARACLPLRVSSLEEEEKIDRASYGPKKEEFSNLGERNSGGLYFPRSEFRLPRALRSSIPHSHPHTKLAGSFVFSDLLPIESTSAQTLEF